MQKTIFTAISALATTLLTFTALIYPAWFEQTYKETDPHVFQGFGLWAFTSTAEISDPFYASETNIQYTEICGDDVTYPNWMLGGGVQYAAALCGTEMKFIQGGAVLSAGISVLILLAAIAAVYRPTVGTPERMVSGLTLLGSLLLSAILAFWGWLVQRSLYSIDRINDQYLASNNSDENWAGWFYGRSFWCGLASVIAMSVTGYINASARNQKILRLRKQNDYNLQRAIMDSTQPQPYASHTTPQAATQYQQYPAPGANAPRPPMNGGAPAAGAQGLRPGIVPNGIPPAAMHNQSAGARGPASMLNPAAQAAMQNRYPPGIVPNGIPPAAMQNQSASARGPALMQNQYHLAPGAQAPRPAPMSNVAPPAAGPQAPRPVPMSNVAPPAAGPQAPRPVPMSNVAPPAAGPQAPRPAPMPNAASHAATQNQYHLAPGAQAPRLMSNVAPNAAGPRQFLASGIVRAGSAPNVPREYLHSQYSAPRPGSAPSASQVAAAMPREPPKASITAAVNVPSPAPTQVPVVEAVDNPQPPPASTYELIAQGAEDYRPPQPGVNSPEASQNQFRVPGALV